MDKRIIFFLILGVLPLLFNNANAEIQQVGQIEKGLDYDNQLLSINPQTGQKTFKTTLGLPERVLDQNNEYVDLIFTNDSSFLQVETGHGSVKLDKSSCVFSFFPKGRIAQNSLPLFTESIIARMATNGTDIWSNVSQINNAACQASWDGQSLQAKKQASAGVLIYRYVSIDGVWKTELEVTNLSSQINKKFAFTQTVDLNKNTVKFGNETKNIDNFNNTVFDRTWIENHQAKLLDLLNGYHFDFDLAFNKLWAITIYDTGVNKSKIAFDFSKDATILLPNQTRIYDPTFTSSTPTVDFNLQDIGNDSCDGASLTNNNDNQLVVGPSAVASATDCYRSVIQWDTTSIPDSATISDVDFGFDIQTLGDSPGNCNYMPMVSKPSTSSDATVWADIASGTPYLSNDSTCTATGNNKSVDLGTSADTDLKNLLSSNWFAVGLKGTSETLDATLTKWEIFAAQNDGTATPKPTLTVVYSTVVYPNAPRDLTATTTGKTTVDLDWGDPNLNGNTLIGYQANRTSSGLGNPQTVIINSTTATAYSVTGLTACTPYSFRIATQGSQAYNASGNVANATTACLDTPAAPTLTATAESDTAVRFTSVNGTTGDRNIAWYGFRCVENSASSWSDLVTNSTVPDPRIYIYSGLTTSDSVTCQWRDGSAAGWGPWSNNATAMPVLDIVEAPRVAGSDRLMRLAEWFDSVGGVYMGMSLFPFLVMMIGFMATPKTTHIFVIITLSFMGILHGSGYYQYPPWFWSLSLLFGMVIVLARRL